MFMPMMMSLYLISIILTILISVSSSNWLIVWAMMEINLMMFIPFICTKKYLMDSSPSIKYFLAQVMGSIVLILFVLMVLNKGSLDKFFSWNSFLLLAMAIKSGTPPFHFWFPQLIEISNWIQMSALLTLQKIIPLVFLSYTISQTFVILIIISGLVGSSGGFNQNSMKKIIAYSSMTHMGWIMVSMASSTKSSLIYFFIYSSMVLVLLFCLKDSSMVINSGSCSSIYSSYNNFLIFVVLLSISGVPPFSGFFIKLMVIQGNSMSLMIVFLMVVFSLISMIYYLRMIYSFVISNVLVLKLKLINNQLSMFLMSSITLINIFTPCLIVYLT